MTPSEATARRAQALILAALLALSVGAWGVLLLQRSGGSSMDAMGSHLTLGMELPLFLGLWAVMMVAMMFPTAAPMVLVFARVSQNRQEQGKPYVPTWFFVASYLLVWTAFGVVAYVAASGMGAVVERVALLQNNTVRITGAIIVAAGVYQLTPLKHACLAQCRSPLIFLMSYWKDGWAGAFRMGTRHGAYCLGCCWMLFVLLLPLGMMNVAAMGLVTALIYVEKSVRHGDWLGRGVGLALVLAGLAVAVFPRALDRVL